jgi:hypothetical protein
VAAGWALDLFRGRQTREHGDVEIAIPHDGGTWICRHDETIRLPHSKIIHHTPDGIPYLAPELVLLFKAKHARPKDQADFDRTIPRMTSAQRATLARLLARVHPGHRWGGWCDVEAGALSVWPRTAGPVTRVLGEAGYAFPQMLREGVPGPAVTAPGRGSRGGCDS